MKIREHRYDRLSRTLTKYPKVPFSGNLKEKAYIIGLRYGDLSVQKHGRNLRISTASTHPDMIKLFESVFCSYGKVGKYPKYNNGTDRYYWSTYCDLDQSFGFLLTKKDSIPMWILENNDYFFSFLSGYFDAEGCLSLYVDPKGNSNVQFIIKTCDKGVLEGILNNLHKLGFEINIRLVKKADGVSYNRDYWYLGTDSKKTSNFFVRKYESKALRKAREIQIVNGVGKHGVEHGKRKDCIVKEGRQRRYYELSGKS